MLTWATSSPGWNVRIGVVTSLSITRLGRPGNPGPCDEYTVRRGLTARMSEYPRWRIDDVAPGRPDIRPDRAPRERRRPFRREPGPAREALPLDAELQPADDAGHRRRERLEAVGGEGEACRRLRPAVPAALRPSHRPVRQPG